MLKLLLLPAVHTGGWQSEELERMTSSRCYREKLYILSCRELMSDSGSTREIC